MKKATRFLYVLALIKFILPFLIQSAYYQPHRDEFLYLAEAKHPAWGFMEVPPLLSVFAMITNAFGGGMFWIKFWPSLFGAFTYIITGRIILSLGGKYFALILAFLGFVTGAYMRVHYLFQPNFLEIFFWTMIAYAVISYTQTEKTKWLYVLGVSIGLGLMSKYSVAFFTFSLALAVLFTKQKTIFLNKHLYYALGIAFIICVPNILWQVNHNYPLMYHMQLLQDEQLQYLSSTGFLTDQLLMSFPSIFVWVAGLCFTGFMRGGKPYRFIALGYLFVIILLLILHGKGYYALGAYPVLFAFGAYQLEQFSKGRNIAWRLALIIIPAFLGYRIMSLLLPFKMPENLAAFFVKKKVEKLGVLKWEDQQNHPLPQDYADMLGWKEISQKVANAYHSLPKEEQAQTMIYSGQYAFAGAVNYYAKELQLPEIYSHNASFLLWMPDKYNCKNIILIQHDIPSPTNPIDGKFKEVIVLDSLNMPLARENGVKVILLHNGPAEVNDLIAQKIGNEKSRFIKK
ncbi:glycosyltransferase family 39 protein [Chitinophagaceae bacterium LWZ2-11]